MFAPVWGPLFVSCDSALLRRVPEYLFHGAAGRAAQAAACAVQDSVQAARSKCRLKRLLQDAVLGDTVLHFNPFMHMHGLTLVCVYVYIILV